MPLHELTEEHRDFAERYHNYVYGFLRWKGLRADDYYDIVIPGFLTAVQVYCDRAELREKYAFSTIAWNQMTYKLKDYYRQQSRPMRKGVTVSLEAMIYDGDDFIRAEAISGPDRLMEELDADLLWEEISGFISKEQAAFLRMRADGYTIHDIVIKKRRQYKDIEAMFTDIQESIPDSCLA